MKIVRAEAIPLAIPFETGGKPAGWGGKAWRALDILLVRIETQNGAVGWGEAFSYNCRRAVQAAFEDMVAPVVIGRDAADIANLMHELQQGLHLFGRYAARHSAALRPSSGRSTDSLPTRAGGSLCASMASRPAASKTP